MDRRAIDRSEWPVFVESFSRRHDGWLISLAVEEEPSGVRRYLTRSAPLRGVTAVMNGDPRSMIVFTGDTAPHMTHFVQRPVSVAVNVTEEGAESDLTITDGSGARTIIEFQSPMLPELVDGIA